MLRASVLAILMSTSGALMAQTPPPCLIVYGHGRNIGSEAENLAWDRLNLRFNQQVATSLDAAGRRVVPMLLRVGSSDLAATLEAVLGEAQRQGCDQVVDTAVFADDASAALVLRLRVHPLLPALGPRIGGGSLPRVGEASYTSQRDFDFSNPRVLERLKLEQLAAEMTAGYLADVAAKP